MIFVWCWFFPVNLNTKEQNFNVYVDRETSAPDCGISRPDQEEIMQNVQGSWF